MARDPFRPDSPFGRNFTQAVPQPNHSNDVPSGAVAGLARAAHEFAGGLRRLADQTLEREGLDDAASDIAAGTAAFRGGFAKDDQAYDQALRGQRVTERHAALLEGLGAVERQHPASPAEFGVAAQALIEGYRSRPLGDPEADLRFSQLATTALGAARDRVMTAYDQQRRQVARGAFVSAVATGETALGQAIAGAGLDDAGAARVAQALTDQAAELARFGPREGFTLGGVDFGPDPTRQDAVSPEELARLYDGFQVGARTSWILDAFERTQGSAARAAFAGQVEEQWAAGNPMFAGISAPQMTQLAAQLRGGVARAETDERAAMSGAAEQARDQLRALEYGGEVDPAQLRALATQSGDVGLAAEVEYRLANGFGVSPRSGASGGGGGVAVGGGFAGAFSFLADHLEGSGFVGDDNGAGRAQYGITERSHPEAWADGRVDRAEAAAIYRRQYWDAIGGDGLDPELAVAAFAAAVVGGVPTARELLAQSGGDVDRFLQLEEARFRRLAAQDPAKYGDDLNGWLNRIGKVRGAIGQIRAERRSADGYASNPIDYARGNRNRPALATVPEFDPAGAFAGGEEGARWADRLRERARLGTALSERDGVPQRLLDNAEATYYRSRLAQEPELIVPLVQQAYGAVGRQGAVRLLGELGRAGVAPADLQLGELATDPNLAGTVDLVVRGRALRSGGARAPSWPNTRSGDSEGLDQAMGRLGEALGEMPAVSPAVRSLAEDMAIADAAAGRLQSPDAYVNSALGATRYQGRRYGGATEVNGAMTVAPDWLDAARLEDALGVAARLWVQHGGGPQFDNGQPVPANLLEQARLRLMPNGRYRLLHHTTGRPYAAPSGGPFEFNIEAETFRDVLNRRLPGAVLPGGRR